MNRSRISLRGLAAVIVACACLCLAPAGGAAAPLALSSNYESGSVSVISTQTNEVLGKPIEVGGRPKSMAISPDARLAYVVNEEFGNVSVIDLSTREVIGEPIKIGGQLGQIALSPDGTTAYVSDYSSKGIVMIDTRTRRVIDEVPLGAYVSGIALAPDGKNAYLAEEEEEALVVMNTRFPQVREKFKLHDRPTGVAVSPDGKMVYVGDELAGLAALETTAGRVHYIPVEANVGPVTVSPDGRTAWVNSLGGSVFVIDLQTENLMKRIQVGELNGPTSITPSGRLAYVAHSYPSVVSVFDAQTFEPVGAPLALQTGAMSELVMTPDQSPTALFTPPSPTPGSLTNFSGAASTDPDGSIATYSWTFGDGASAVGPVVAHAYAAPGTYPAQLSVIDNEGCGAEEVFTGRTAYCSGNPASKVIHPVEVKATPAPPACTPNFSIAGVSHNRKNGTVRLRVKFPGTGSFLLFGKKVHAITRKVRKPGTAVLILHPRVELAKELKTTLRAPVRYRITFTPSAGCGTKTMHRSVALLRAPRRPHHR